MQCLQEQRRFADARIAAEQRDLPGDEPAAERAIELGEAARDALELASLYRLERDRLRRVGGVTMSARLLHRGLGERAGRAARRAGAEPLQRRSAALGAHIGAFRARHYATSVTGTRGASAHR